MTQSSLSFQDDQYIISVLLKLREEEGFDGSAETDEIGFTSEDWDAFFNQIKLIKTAKEFYKWSDALLPSKVASMGSLMAHAIVTLLAYQEESEYDPRVVLWLKTYFPEAYKDVIEGNALIVYKVSTH